MSALVKRFLTSLVVLALVIGVAVLVTSTQTLAKGKPQPKCPQCQPTITLPDGTVCTLVSCGSDCVYSCPIPAP